jgi:hypothetical protein
VLILRLSRLRAVTKRTLAVIVKLGHFRTIDTLGLFATFANIVRFGISVTTALIALTGKVDPVVNFPPKLSNRTTLTNGFLDISLTFGRKRVSETMANFVTVRKKRRIETILTTATMLRTVRLLIIGTILRILIRVIIPFIVKTARFLPFLTSPSIVRKRILLPDPILDIFDTIVTKDVCCVNPCHRHFPFS